MALNTQYIPTKYFQEIFVDVDSGCPLGGGKVKFYKDNDRVTGKDVFILSGTPPTYTYVNIGDELTLSAAGTFQYNNDDVTVYLFPYDADGKIELYYAVVESAGSTPQFTREAFPNVEAGEDGEEDIINYVPNGQFLLHHDIVADEGATPAIEAGEITDDVTVIAEGGWSFERTTGSAAKDFVLFERIGSFVEVPSKSPRYSLRVKNESPGIADVFKDVRLTYRDVNKFASDTEQFTFVFQAKSNGGASTIEVKLRKFFGTGGSATEETVLEVINLTSDYQLYDIPFVFGKNDGKTIGDNDDDYVQLNISLPVSSTYDNNFDTVMLLKGDKQVTEFIDTSDAQFIRDSNAGWMPVPDYEGADLYLPIRKGLKGLEYDTSAIGKMILKSTETLETSELWFDGSKYRVAQYSDDKIPYRRLYEKWSVNSDVGLSIYGTGDDEMRYSILETTDQSFATSDTDSNINNDSWQSFTPAVTGKLINISVTTGTPAPAANSIVSIYEGEGTTGNLLARETGINFGIGIHLIQIGARPTLTTGLKYSIRIQNAGAVFWRTNAAGGYAGGSYNGTAADAEFSTSMSETSLILYRLYSNTGGAVVAAADGAVPTGFTFTPVQPDPYIIDITAVAAGGMTVSSYWTYNTTDARKYIIWYEIDGSGTQPVEVAAVYRKVSILSTDTAAIVNNKTALAINSYSIKIPDWRGYFIRITNDKEGVDPDTALRTDRGDGNVGDAVGTIQQDEVGPIEGETGIWANFGAPTVAGGANDSVNQANTGLETRSKNRYANLAVKY